MGIGSKHSGERVQLDIGGPFRLSRVDGTAFLITSKRSKALLSILATSKNMEKTRAWLQNTLWCDRSKSQSQASLRRELSNLRIALNDISPELIWANKEMIGLNPDFITVDILQNDTALDKQGEILEGFDLPNEENFEIWLRYLRNEHSQKTPVEDGQISQEYSRVGQPSLSIWPDIKGLSNEGEILVSGVIDTLFEHLPKLRWLDLINSPWRSKENADVPDKDIAKVLNVEYLLKCRCIENAKEKTIQFKLLKVQQAKVIWAESINLSWPLNGKYLRELVMQIVASVQSTIQTSEQLKSTKVTLPQLTVNALVWRARWHMKRLTKIDAALAIEAIETAINRSPDDKEVLLQKAFIDGWNAWVKSGSRDQIKKIRSMVQHVRDLDPYDARPYLLNGVLETWLRNHASSEALLKRSLALNPCLAEAYGNLGGCYNYWGRPSNAIEPLQLALRFNPLGMENFFQLTELALSHFMMNQFKDAIEYCDKALAIRPAYPYAHAIKIACYYYSDDQENYIKFLKIFLEVRQNIPGMFEWLPFEDRGWVRKITLPLIDRHKLKSEA